MDSSGSCGVEWPADTADIDILAMFFLEEVRAKQRNPSPDHLYFFLW
jgi:hypothetical protein